MLIGPTIELPESERIVLELLSQGKSQVEIARELGITQPTVHYRIKRAKERQSLVKILPEISEEYFQDCAEHLKVNDPYRQTWRLFLEHRSQVKTAQVLGVSQGLVRHHLVRFVIPSLESSKDPQVTSLRVATLLVFNNSSLLGSLA